MKLFSTILSAAVVSAALIGCAGEPHHVRSTEPSVMIEPAHRTIMVGESTRLVAHTVDVAGSSAVKWSVSPNVGKITTDAKSGQSAMFSADQAGTYVIQATVQRSDGQWVTSPDLAITVNGRMSNDK